MARHRGRIEAQLLPRERFSPSTLTSRSAYKNRTFNRDQLAAFGY